MHSTLHIADKTFSSRLFTGTGKFGSHSVMQEALIASETQLTTVALRRVDVRKADDEMLSYQLVKIRNSSRPEILDA